MQIHATVVSIEGNGVVLRGDSGSGKSDLALRLINNGAVLVADDRCDITTADSVVMASAPKEIAGMLEIRGLGIYRLDYLERVPVALVIDLVEDNTVERLPEPALCSDFSSPIPCIRLASFEVSAPDKILMAVRHTIGDLESVS